MRAELDAVEAGFDKLPTLSGNGGELVVVNAGGTALTSITAGATTEVLVGGGVGALPVWTAATGSGAPVRATSPTLVTPTLGVATATSVNGLVMNTGVGANSVAIGATALSSITTGSTNTAVGKTALALATSATNCVALGYDALGTGVVTGGSHTAIGAYAGRKITTASGPNTLVGSNAGAELTTGRNNTGIGASSFANKATGNENVAIGDSAHTNITTGDNTICIGYNTNPSSNGVSNEVTLGNSSITTLRCQVTSITALSDARDKTDVVPLTTGLATVMQLNPVRFTWHMRDGGKVGIKDAGFIAQDLQQVDDEHLRLVYAENPEKLEASYGRLIPVLVKAIQELKQEFDEYKAQHP